MLLKELMKAFYFAGKRSVLGRKRAVLGRKSVDLGRKRAVLAGKSGNLFVLVFLMDNGVFSGSAAFTDYKVRVGMIDRFSRVCI